MVQVLCTLEHAAEKISGVKFSLHKIDNQPVGMISEEITEAQAERFLGIPGYELVEEDEKPAAAPAPAPKPAPAPAAPKAPSKAEKAAAAAKAAEEKEAAEKAASEAQAAAEAAAAAKAAEQEEGKSDEKKEGGADGDKPAEEVF